MTRLEAVFRSATDPILIEDLDGLVIDLNDEAVSSYGFERAELLGQPIKRIVPSDRHAQADELLARCRAGEVVRNVEGVRITKDGRRIQVLLSFALLSSAEGEPEAIATFAKDITALRQSEAEAKQMSLVYMNAADPIVIEDLSGNIIDLNLEAIRTYGWQRDELVGRPIKRIVPDERHHQADELLESCVSGHDVRNVEGLRVAKDGTVYDILVTLSLLRDENDEPIAVASIAKNITSLRQSEAEAKRLSRVFMDAADPMIIEDLLGNVIELNREAERAYGWSRDDFIGQPIKQIVPDERHSQAEELLQRCLRGDEVRNVEGLRVSREGQVFDVLITLSLLSDENGEPIGVASIAKDITALKQAESEIAGANEQLAHELAVARELSSAADGEFKTWLLGESIAVRALREGIAMLAESDDPLLMTGAAGSGQQAIARAIHRESSRKTRPFIYVACHQSGDTRETLFRLGDDEDGSSNPGKFYLADGGTLFLENIEALSLDAQQQLLSVLREAATARRENQTASPDVRVITSSSTDLTEAMHKGQVDAELASLLGLRRLPIPTLAERREDIAQLANALVSARAQSIGKSLTGISTESRERLAAYSWPGNVGELKSVIERAVVLSSGPAVEVPPELLQEGRRIGGYSLERQLGSGAMGDVWLARHSLLARPAAVKLIRQDAIQGDAGVRETLERRFRREAEATAKLRSPHTVELYDFGVTEDGDFYYVMEYLSGLDLDSLVARFGRISAARATFLLRQACMSLGEAHQSGLIHRDIKPANLFTCQLGPHYDFLKLLDFGIVRATDNTGHSVTSPGQLKGTPNSLAPEVIQGEEAAAAADLYGLGCVAYWLLAGQHVFEAPHLMALLMQHVSNPPKPLSEFRSDIPPELERLVLSCLEKDPANRPASAFELERSLASVALSDPWDGQAAAAWWEQSLHTNTGGSPEHALDETVQINLGDTE